jgi:hypothetical protein
MIVSISLFSSLLLVLTPVTAQILGPPGWEMGIEYIDEDETKPFLISESGSVTLTFWVRNDYSTNSITVQLEYDVPFDGDSTASEEITVDAGDNDTFSLKMHTIGVGSYEAGKTDSFQIEAVLSAIGPLPAGIFSETKRADGILQVPRVVSLHLAVSDPTGPLNSGGSTTIDAIVTNKGNSDDSVLLAENSDDCPLLDVSGFSALEGRVIPSALKSGNSISVELELSASESHQDGRCLISFTVWSQGDQALGRLQPAAESETSITVEKGSGGSSTAGGGGSSGSGSGPNDPEEVVSSNFLPIGLWPILVGLLAALLRRPTRANLAMR